MNKITIIDYGCGNILNLTRAIKFLGYTVETTHDKKKILNSSHVILPGVGAFGNATQQLEKYNLYVYDAEKLKVHGGMLRVYVSLRKKSTTKKLKKIGFKTKK